MQAVCQKIGGTEFDSMYNKHQAIRLQMTVPVFMDGAGQQTEYEYDENGNLTKDLNKKISCITYNFLNLPKEIMFMDGSYIHYTYDAAGTLLRKGYYVKGNTTISGIL